MANKINTAHANIGESLKRSFGKTCRKAGGLSAILGVGTLGACMGAQKISVDANNISFFKKLAIGVGEIAYFTLPDNLLNTILAPFIKAPYDQFKADTLLKGYEFIKDLEGDPRLAAAYLTAGALFTTGVLTWNYGRKLTKN